jgi:transcriptional regulator with XRE-family HTH domain
MKITKQLGMRIAYLRKQKKWSQEELSFQSNINKNYICDIENGRRNPTLEVLSKISNGLGITLEFLFKGIQSFDE